MSDSPDRRSLFADYASGGISAEQLQCWKPRSATTPSCAVISSST